MKPINKLILFSLLIFTLSSCNVFKDIFKNKTKTEKDVNIKLDKDSIAIIKDNSTTVIEEKLDTTIKTKEVKFEGIKPITNLTDIKNLIILNNDLVNISQTYDSLTGNLKTNVILKGRDIDLKFNKKTTKNNDILTKTKVNTNLNLKEKDKNLTVITETKATNAIWFVVLGLGVLAVLYFLGKRFI